MIKDLCFEIIEKCLNNCKFCIVPHGKVTPIPDGVIIQQMKSFSDLDYRLVYIDDKTLEQLEETKLNLEKTQDELNSLKIEFNDLKQELKKSIESSNKISEELKEIKSLAEKQTDQVTIKDAVLITSPNNKKNEEGFFGKVKNLLGMSNK